MGIKIAVSKRVFGFDESKTEKYVVTPVISGEVTFEKLCTQVCQICGAHRGTVQLVTAGLIDALVNNLEDGKSIRLGEFGIFRPAINAKAKTRRRRRMQARFIVVAFGLRRARRLRKCWGI